MAFVPNINWGTPHGIIGGKVEVLNTNPSDTDNHTLDVSAYVDGQTKAIAGYAEIEGTSSGQIFYIRDASGNDWMRFELLSAGDISSRWYMVPLNDDKEFIWRAAHSTLTDARIYVCVMYY